MHHTQHIFHLFLVLFSNGLYFCQFQNRIEATVKVQDPEEEEIRKRELQQLNDHDQRRLHGGAWK